MKFHFIYDNYKLVGSSVSALLLVGALATLSVVYPTDKTGISFSLLIVVLGLAIGWLLGIVVSPYTKEEKESFTEYAKALGLFVSGYLVGKIDKAVEAIFNPTFLIDNPANGFRLMAFVAAVIVAVVITFVFRMYASNPGAAASAAAAAAKAAQQA